MPFICYTCKLHVLVCFPIRSSPDIISELHHICDVELELKQCVLIRNVEGCNSGFVGPVTRNEPGNIVSTSPNDGLPTSAIRCRGDRAFGPRPWSGRVGRARHVRRSIGSRPNDSRYKIWMLEVLTDIALFLIYVDDILVRTPKIRNSHRIGTALDGGDSVDIFVDIGDRDSTSIIIRWRMFQ